MSHKIGSSAFLAVILVVLLTGSMLAQPTSASATVNASATVLAQLTITKTADVAFGNVGATTVGPVYIDPLGSAHTYVGSGATVGGLTVSGANSQSVRLSWPASITLTDAGTDVMTYTLKVNGLNANTQASSGMLGLSSGYYDATTSASGKYYLWVGGDLGTLASQAAGVYSGTASFTVEYN